MRRQLLGVLLSGAALACGGDDQGPVPVVRLSIQGQIRSAEPVPVPIEGATVALRRFYPDTVVRSTTDHAGNYQLIYEFSSRCGADDNTTVWVEASAEGYEAVSTDFSDTVIYCTSVPQVIDLSLRPYGWLQVITTTGGSAPDSDGYTLVIGDTLGYTFAASDEKFLPQISGQYSLELTEVAENCSVAGDNPRTAPITARDTTLVAFEVMCTL